MSTINAITVKAFKDVLDSYFAPPEQRHQMTPQEMEQIAAELNKRVNIPFFNEKQEFRILIKVVLKVDTFLYNNLPNEFYDLVRSVPDGIDKAEAKRLIKRLSKLANNAVDIPYIPEAVEGIVIRAIISLIINAARKGKMFNKELLEESFSIL